MATPQDTSNENNIVVYNDPEKLYIGNPFLFSKLDLSNIQFQIFCEMVAHIQKGDTEFNTYRLFVKDFADRIGLSTTAIYPIIRTAARGMMQHIVQIREDNGIDFKERVLVTGADYMRTKGFVDLKFNNDLKPYLLNLDGEFFTAHLEAIRRIRNIILGKLYWFCVRWVNASMPVTIEIGKLRVITECVDKYERYRDFKREVLDKGIDVFKEHGKVTYSYEEVREKPRNKKSEVIKIKLFIRRNKPTWEQPELEFKPSKKLPNPETENMIDEIFSKIEIWGFEREEAKKLVEKYQNIEHLFDKINYVKTNLKSGKIDNPKSYLISVLEKNPNLISSESIRKANTKKKQKQAEQQQSKQESLQPYLDQLEELKQKYRQKEQETLVSFFAEFPDLKAEMFNVISAKFSMAYEAWKKNNDINVIPLTGAIYGLLVNEVQSKYHIFDTIRKQFAEIETALKTEMEKI